MIISKTDFELFLQDFVSKIEKIEAKVKLYADEEVKIRGGSNFSLMIHPEFKRLKDIIKQLSVLPDFNLDESIVNELFNFKAESNKQITEFDNLIDSIHSTIKNKPSEAFFYSIFSDWVNSVTSCALRLFDKYKESNRINQAINKIEQYEKVLLKSETQADSLGQLIQNKINAIEEINNKLKESEKTLLDTKICIEQEIANSKVLDISKYYTKYKDSVISEKRLYGTLYFLFSAFFAGALLFMFIKLPKIFSETDIYLRIAKSIITCSFIGFVTFLTNDFRRRFNICKQILDEVEQKVAIVNTYSSLLSRIEDFDESIKIQYHEKILNNIMETLLLIKNHGFLSKTLQQSAPNVTNIAAELIEQISKLSPGTKA